VISAKNVGFCQVAAFTFSKKSKVLSGWRAPTFAAVRREVEKTSVFLWGAEKLQAGQIDRGFPWFRQVDLPHSQFAP
jgi:hypothetical protein